MSNPPPDKFSISMTSYNPSTAKAVSCTFTTDLVIYTSGQPQPQDYTYSWSAALCPVGFDSTKVLQVEMQVSAPIITPSPQFFKILKTSNGTHFFPPNISD